MEKFLFYWLNTILISLVLCGCAVMRAKAPEEQKEEHFLIVAPEGGDFEKITEALKFTENLPEEVPAVIFVTAGIYEENDVNIRRSNVHLYGMDPKKCIIQGKPRNIDVVNIYNREKDIQNITIENLTLRNRNKWGEYGTRAQEALSVGHPSREAKGARRVVVRNCHLYGYQDTTFVYPNSEATYIDCLIDGGFDIASIWRAKANFIRCDFVMHHPKACGAVYVDSYEIRVWDCRFDSEYAAAHVGALDVQGSENTVWFIGNWMGRNITDGIYFERGIKLAPEYKIVVGKTKGKEVKFHPDCTQWELK